MQLATGHRTDDREFFIDDGDIGKIDLIRGFDYIGHRFTRDDTFITDKGISRIKRRVTKIIYVHLLHNLKRGLFSPQRIGIGFYDWDLVTCVNELKLYIYGGLKEAQLNSFIEQNRRISRFKGLMSFYPLVTSVKQFAELDGWLVSVVRRAIKERSKLLQARFSFHLEPISAAQIKDGSWYQFQSGISLETRAPSFVLAWRAARKAFKQYGLTDFEPPKYYSTMFSGYASSQEAEY